MKKLLLPVGLLFLIFSFSSSLFAQDIAIISSIPTDKEIDQIALAPNTGIAYGINKQEKRVCIFDFENYTVKTSLRLDKNPRSIAVDSTSNLAYITAQGYKNGQLYIIDSQGTILQIKDLPKDPEGIAVNPNNKTAVISIEKGRKLIILSTEDPSIIKEIPLQHKPNLIALDTDTQRAAITTKTHTWGWRHNKLQIIDLNTGKILKQTNLKKDIRGLALDSQKDIAITVSSEQINLIDINTGNIITAISPEKDNPKNIKLKKGSPDTEEENPEDKQNETETIDEYIAIDINQTTHIAAITGEEGIILIDLNQNTIREYPLEEIKELKTIAADKYQNTIISAYTKDKTQHKHKPSWWNKHQHGVLQIQLPNPEPEITTVTPSVIQRGSSAASLTITGDKFITTTAVYLNSQNITSTFLDNNNLSITIPSEMTLQAGFLSIEVLNPQPGGGSSNIFSIPVNNPIPTIISIEPQELTAGTTPQTLTIIGTGFFPETEIHINKKDETAITKKQGTLITNTKLQLPLTQEDLKTSGQYEIRAYNPVPGGGYSNTAILTVKPSLEITITSPQNNQTINKTKTIIKGTYKTGTKDIGITVNGIIADITDSEWTANVPLTTGANTITAVIKDNEANKTETTITINVIEQTQYIQLTANIVSGIAPLTTYFTVSTQTTNPIASYQIDYEGDGIVDYTGTAFDNISHSYTQEGIFYPTITVIDDQDNTYTDTIVITVLNKTEVDTLLKSKWDGMKQALRTKDIDAALNYLSVDIRDKFREIFNALSDDLPNIVNSLTDIKLISVKDNTAKYYIKKLENGKEYAYFIYFVRDENGIWKINNF